MPQSNHARKIRGMRVNPVRVMRVPHQSETCANPLLGWDRQWHNYCIQLRKNVTFHEPEDTHGRALTC